MNVILDFNRMISYLEPEFLKKSLCTGMAGHETRIRRYYR